MQDKKLPIPKLNLFQIYFKLQTIKLDFRPNWWRSFYFIAQIKNHPSHQTLLPNPNSTAHSVTLMKFRPNRWRESILISGVFPNESACPSVPSWRGKNETRISIPLNAAARCRQAVTTFGGKQFPELFLPLLAQPTGVNRPGEDLIAGGGFWQVFTVTDLPATAWSRFSDTSVWSTDRLTDYWWRTLITLTQDEGGSLVG